MSDEYMTDDEWRIASLGLAALTAYVNDDAAGTARVLNDHISAASTPRDAAGTARVLNDHISAASTPRSGQQDAVNGLLVTAGVLLHKLSRATGQTQEEILQELGVAYAERGPDGRP